MPSYSDEEILAEIRRVADHPAVDGVPSMRAFDDYANISSSTIVRRFGSWGAAVDQAGLDRQSPPDKIPRDELVAELRRLRDDLDQIPTADQMDDHGAYAYITYYERFGSWADALEEVFGEVPDRRWEHVSDDELIAELQQLAGDNGECPTTTDVQERGAHAVTTYNDRFGSWRDALEAAGFEPPPPQGVTTEALLADLRRLHDDLGGRPTTTVVREHGLYALPTYYSRFDSWGDALGAAFETVPTDAVNEGSDDKAGTKAHSDEELLEEIRRVADIADSDGAPSISEFDEYSDIADSTIHRRFGSWNDGLEAAGFERRPAEKPITEAELIEELHRLADELGHVPTRSEMKAKGAYSEWPYVRQFSSWSAALEATFDDVEMEDLGVRASDATPPEPPESPEPSVHISEDELCAELRRVADEHRSPPPLNTMNEHGAYSGDTYLRRFGSWEAALTAAGFEDTQVQPKEQSQRSTRVSTDDLIADLHRLSDELGEQPTATDVVEEGAHGLATYQRRFGSWTDALDAAGFDPDDGPSDDDLLSDLDRLHELLDKIPSLLDVAEEGQYSQSIYQSRFGSWTNALDAAGFDPDRGPTDAELLDELHRLQDDLDKRPSMRDMTAHGAYGCTTYRRRFGSWSAALEVAFDDTNADESS